MYPFENIVFKKISKLWIDQRWTELNFLLHDGNDRNVEELAYDDESTGLNGLNNDDSFVLTMM